MSPIFTARPYAAKAIIVHEFDTDHLNIWITFRFTMNITTKPANAKWICVVDEVVKAVTTSAWQDAWTMLLTVNGIASIPDRVTIEYDGPDPTLTTTWNKQWEPWGPILSSDSSLLPFGYFYGSELNWQQAAAQNTWYPILDAGIVNDNAHKMTFQTAGVYKILVSGFYTIFWYITCECSIAGKHVLGSLSKNGAQISQGETHIEFGRANEEGPMSAGAIISLAVDDTIGIGLLTDDAGNPTLTVDHLGFKISEIGTA